MHPPNTPSSSIDPVPGRNGLRPSLRGARHRDYGPGWTRPPAALLILPPRRRVLFEQVLEELGVSVCCVQSCRAARGFLQPPGSLGLVVTHVSLPDGNWCDVLRMMNDLGVPASVVVDAPEVNHTLWSEVFWRGAYDLLVQPCEWGDVRQCFEGALRARPVSPPLNAQSAA